jgi:signal transduction histidine kinase
MIGSGQSKWLHVILILAIALGYAVAILQYELYRPLFVLANEWSSQFYILLLISALLSMWLLFVRHLLAICAILALRLTATVILGYPLAVNPWIEFTLFLLLVLEIATNLDWRAAAPASAAALTVLLIFQRDANVFGERVAAPPVHTLLTFAMYGLGAVLAAVLIRMTLDTRASDRAQIEQLKQTVKQLSNANLGVLKHASVVEERSKANERKRVTAEIHDTIVYTLTNLIMMMEAARDLRSEPARLQELLRRARAQAQEGLNEARRALRLLRREGERPVPTLNAVRRLVNAFQDATGVQVKLEFANCPAEFPAAVAHTLYRVAREGMSNALRHGRASSIILHFWRDDDSIELRIQDNGIGKTANQEGIGLEGLRESVSELRGEVATRNTANGFELSVRLPINITEGVREDGADTRTAG